MDERGTALIELVVVAALISILVGGLRPVLSFLNNQRLDQEAVEMLNVLRLTREVSMCIKKSESSGQGSGFELKKNEYSLWVGKKLYVRHSAPDGITYGPFQYQKTQNLFNAYGEAVSNGFDIYEGGEKRSIKIDRAGRIRIER